ncbi:putative proton ATPase [Cardiosporidium cionae]|uniref:Proton ATPase n=1 Tax=Cardiosporidium cionae TaxID=476202 RepID=A0ABQ7JDF1_9APIC|nr:putative proton ATPase [Cardiosporidium cionae]|eukprot:KAF8822028.1 putative proton ATPase [Cardiosporidium cionae]
MDTAKDVERCQTPYQGLSRHLQTNSVDDSEEILLKQHPFAIGKLLQGYLNALFTNFNRAETNRIRTAKYNIFTLIPMTIFYQLLRFGNFYFLIIAFLQLIPAISDTNGIPTYGFPIAIVILLATIREFFQDSQRHRSDREENMQLVNVCKGRSIIQKKWQDLKIGDVVKVYASEHFPADLLLLNCADKYGICNIETKNVDGETNLKHKHCLPDLSNIFTDDCTAGIAMVDIFYEPSCSDILRFNGIAKLTSPGKSTNDDSSEMHEVENTTRNLTLDEKQFLLRGASLVSTKWVYGCVLYIGHKTRLLASSKTIPPNKKSRLDLLYSSHVVLIALFQFIFLVVQASIALVWNLGNESQVQLLLSGNTFQSAAFFFKSIGSSFILTAAMIPAELLILWEFNRWLQGRAINRNPELSVEAGESAQARAKDLIEEMGNISHVYTDKTGTLTKNLMCLQCIGMGSTAQFGFKQWTARRSLLSQNVPELRDLFQKMYEEASNQTGNDEELVINQECQRRSSCSNLGEVEVESILSFSLTSQQNFRLLLLIFSLCHTVCVTQPSKDESDDFLPKHDGKSKEFDPSITILKPLSGSVSTPVYEASSPDELAIVTAASQIGFEFIARPTLTTCEVRVVSPLCIYLCKDVIHECALASKHYSEKDDTLHEGNGYSLLFPLLTVMDFDSARKRTTVVTRDLNGKILLLCKGADSSLLQIISPDNRNVSSILGQVEKFASAGLRTMLFGYKYLKQSDFDNFLIVYRQAKTLRGKEGNAAVTRAFESIEKGLIILGCTGIEDGLQENVPDVIQNLREAGIKIWMLTGDRMETAENIARSINLMNENTCSVLINETDQNKLSAKLSSLERSIGLAALFNETDKKWWSEIDWELLGIKLQELNNTEEQQPELTDVLDFLRRMKRSSDVVESEIDARVEASDAYAVDSSSPKFESYFLGNVAEMHDFSITSAVPANFSSRKRLSLPLFSPDRQMKHKQQQVAFSASHIPDNKRKRQLKPVTMQLSSLLKEITSKDNQTLQSTDFLTAYRSFAVLITGDSFEALRKDLNLKIRFYSLCRHAASVVACRLTPDQKAILIKENSAFNPRSSSLAIGDGANDVDMILAANVGVGIIGKEGVEAARASDFSIRKFHHIRTLLFVHGRETLRRSCFLIYFCVFRGAYSILIIAFYNYFNLFSNTDIWNLWAKQFMTTLFVSLPVFVVVAYDVYVPHEILVAAPAFYRIKPSSLWPYTESKFIQSCKSRIKKTFNRLCRWVKQSVPFLSFSSKKLKYFYLWIYRCWYIRSQPHHCSCCGWSCLFLWFGFAFWVAIVQLFCILFGLTGPIFPVVGLEFGFPTVGVESLFVAVHPLYVLTAILIPAYFAHTWFTITHIVIWGELFLYFAVSVAISFMQPIRTVEGGQPIFGSFLQVHLSLQFYLMLLIALLASFFPLLFFSGWQNFFKPTMEQELIENLRNGKQVTARHAYPSKKLYFSSKIGHETRGYGFAIEPKDPLAGLIQEAVVAQRKEP